MAMFFILILLFNLNPGKFAITNPVWVKCTACISKSSRGGNDLNQST